MDNVTEQGCCECGPGCGDCQDMADCLDEVTVDGRDLAGQVAELRRRLARVETAFEMLAKRRICALMTDVDALERHVLERDVTTADLKKAGMRAMGLDRK